MKRRIAALFSIGALALSLSACSSSSDKADDGKTTAAEPTVVVSTEGMPTVNNSGDIPQIVFPDSKAPADLQVAVLEEGKGAEIAKDDWVSVDYVGTVWGSDEPFDSSYSRSVPLTMSLTQLVPGWGYGLEGRHVGDKLLLSIPPEYGYGSEGQPAAGIGGTDTIVFYIDIHQAWTANASGQKDATVEVKAEDLPIEIDGGIGEPITTLKVKEGSAEPTELTMRVMARGTGTEIGATDTIYYQVAQAYWDNSNSVTTWAKDGEEVKVGVQNGPIGTGTILDGLAGIPVGSRVFLEVPADTENGTPAVAAIVDVLGATPTPAS
ncbi:MAG: FKBP-type peptidyl-prolyl cis-trans isomerase [Actinomycetaceae bacterium]|nr:FKBP-type peptidyl-prolyl cis-trans isomerase [Actinomycetaceae bacterium]